MNQRGSTIGDRRARRPWRVGVTGAPPFHGDDSRATSATVL